MIIGISSESSFSGSPDSLSFKSTNVAGPEYAGLIVISALKSTRFVVIQSPCACIWPCAIFEPSGACTMIGATASLNQFPGALPITVNVFVTLVFALGNVTTRRSWSGLGAGEVVPVEPVSPVVVVVVVATFAIVGASTC